MLKLVWDAGEPAADRLSATQEFDAREFAAWNVAPSGHYAQDCARGRAKAEELIAFVRDSKLPATLGYVVQSLMHSGREMSGIEIGFFHRISEELS